MTGAGKIVIINDFSVARGGATKLALSLVTQFAQEKKDVTLFTGDAGNNDALTALGVKIAAVGGEPIFSSYRKGLFSGLYNRDAEVSLRSFIAKNDSPDVVYHVHGWAQILSPSIFSALKSVAHRTIVTAHDFFLVCPNGIYTDFPREAVCSATPLSAKCISTNCDKRSYAHKAWRVGRQAMLKRCLDFDDDPYTFVAVHPKMGPILTKGGVRADQLKSISNPAMVFRDRRVEAENNNQFVFIGRLQHVKGAELFAAAARRAGVKSVFVGQGPEEEKIRAANPDADLLGWCSADEIKSTLLDARFVVMPSRSIEPYGIVAAEAISAGVPVLLSDRCLIGDDVAAFGMGQIVDVFDEMGFAQTLSALSADNMAVKTMSERAFENSERVTKTERAWFREHDDLYRNIRTENAA